MEPHVSDNWRFKWRWLANKFISAGYKNVYLRLWDYGNQIAVIDGEDVLVVINLQEIHIKKIPRSEIEKKIDDHIEGLQKEGK
jgi:hypothetical protein